MKVLLNNIGFGHAPKYAICSQGREFRFEEKLMQDLVPAEIADIKAKGGEIPTDLALKLAKNGCFYFDGGKCILQNGAECRG